MAKNLGITLAAEENTLIEIDEGLARERVFQIIQENRSHIGAFDGSMGLTMDFSHA
jgi:hypothetical protein